jgi:demethylmenaquinone methyltransferase/2-methoxy-6-polyprenyl-1,4-benzoquinol methylase
MSGMAPLEPVRRGGIGGSGQMFDEIARRYDLLNRVLSLGLDQSWRRTAIAALELPPGARVLDLATGTGDLALALAARGHRVVGLDPSAGMLDVAREKAASVGREVEWVQGDAQALDAEDASFDGVTIAFGIRNVPDRAKALGEMLRVLRPGARLAVLELGEPESGLLVGPARWYIRVLVPRIGAALSGAREYRYLQASIAEFPRRAEFAERMREVGFVDVEARPLSFAACNLFVGRRP